MVLVALAVDRLVGLVLHLEHDGDHFHALFVELAVDVVALRAAARVVVLVELRVAERRGAQLVERHLAVLLQAFAEHLHGQLRLHVADALDLALAVRDELVFGLQLLGELGLMLGAQALVFGLGLLARHAQLVALPLDGAQLVFGGVLRLRGRQLLLHVERPVECGKPPLQLRDLGVALRSRRLGRGLQFRDALLARGKVGLGLVAGLGQRQLHRLLALRFHELRALLHGTGELRVAHLPHDVGEPRLVDLEHGPALRALDLVHRQPPFRPRPVGFGYYRTCLLFGCP